MQFKLFLVLKLLLLKTKIDDYLENVPEAYDEEKTIVYHTTDLEIGNIVDGEVLPIEDCSDDIFAHKLLGDGLDSALFMV